jgi:hypothetical protein
MLLLIGHDVACTGFGFKSLQGLLGVGDIFAPGLHTGDYPALAVL